MTYTPKYCQKLDKYIYSPLIAVEFDINVLLMNFCGNKNYQKLDKYVFLR